MSIPIHLHPSGKSFELHPEEHVLDGGISRGIPFQYGCRSGSCGMCKAKLLAGTLRERETPSYTLSSAERSAGYVLLCQCEALEGPVELEVQLSDGQALPIRHIPCRVEHIEKHDGVFLLKLKLPVQHTFSFFAGQYVDLMFHQQLTRSYSIASSPEQKGFIDIHIRDRDTGEATSFLREQLKTKDILRLRGPLGVSFLRLNRQRPLLFLASGTGIAPVRSMLSHLQSFAPDFSHPIQVYWGGFTYPCHMESIHIANIQHFSSDVEHEVLSTFTALSNYDVYACGAPAMVEAARQACIRKGVPEEAFFADAFYPSSGWPTL